MSIRLRLTLLYGVILAATLAIFSVMLYLTLASSTRAMMEDTLALDMQRVTETNVQSPRAVRWPRSTVRDGAPFWQACDSQGKVLDRTDNLQDHELPLSDEGLSRVQNGEAIYESARVDDEPMLVHSRPLIANGEVTGILQVARSTAEQERALNLVGKSLIAGSILIVGLALGIGWVISGAALRPIDQMTRVAAMIEAERTFERRVDYTGPQDEVGRLATTFNAMLASLQDAYQQTAQALQAQRWFVADASHELRTPLTTLRGNVALLQREPPIAPEDRRAVLADIAEECDRMIRLVKDLLLLARTDNATPFEPEAVPLAPLLAEIERQVAAEHPAHQWSCSYPKDVAIVGRRDLLKQVLLILIDNAFKFTPAGGSVRLDVRQEGSNLTLAVEDTGIGIAEGDQARIFQRFYRSDQARSTAGYGLGLPIAKALVEKQGGAISVTSTPGEGSVFSVSLRVAERAAEYPVQQQPLFAAYAAAGGA